MSGQLFDVFAHPVAIGIGDADRRLAVVADEAVLDGTVRAAVAGVVVSVVADLTVIEHSITAIEAADAGRAVADPAFLDGAVGAPVAAIVVAVITGLAPHHQTISADRRAVDQARDVIDEAVEARLEETVFRAAVA